MLGKVEHLELYNNVASLEGLSNIRIFEFDLEIEKGKTKTALIILNLSDPEIIKLCSVLSIHFLIL
jgi:hypothetical protein